MTDAKTAEKAVSLAVPAWSRCSLRLKRGTAASSGVPFLSVTPRGGRRAEGAAFCPLKGAEHSKSGKCSLLLRQNGLHYFRCFARGCEGDDGHACDSRQTRCPKRERSVIVAPPP